MGKIILHIDLNTFFVRCEEIKNPALENKPVIIGHVGRGGIVSTCSYEARKYGVSSGMPMFKATKLCPKAIIIKGDYDYYSKKSSEFINFVKKYAQKVEQASIDECYADMSEELKKCNDVEAYLKNMQQTLLKETGLKCSIGVASIKFLAKMGSDLKKPMGITIIRRKDIPNLLYPLPIDSFYGIGKKTAPLLKEIGINTIGDLKLKIDENDPRLKNILGKFYFTAKDWINGYGDNRINQQPYDPKSIGNSHTLDSDTNNYDELAMNISLLAKEVAKRAEEANKVGNCVQIVLKDNSFKVINRSSTLKKATNKEEEIKTAALKLLDNNFDEDKLIRLVGVTLQNLVDPSDMHVQLSIFDNYDEIKEECATKLIIAELNRKMKKSIFKTARDSLKGE